MRRALLNFVLLIVLPFSAAALEIDFLNTAPQGGMITVIVKGSSGPADIELRTDERRIARTKSFRFEMDGRAVDIALIGVPSTLEPGSYILVARNGRVRTSGTVRVSASEYISEDISLDRNMSGLRQSGDSRKAEESRKLYEIFTTVDTESIFGPDDFVMPVEPLRRTSFFGDRRRFLYSDGTTAMSIHYGVDYSAETGTPVYAAGRGRVVLAADRMLTGNTVVLEHLPGVYSLYYHLDSLDCSEGDILEKGRLLGTVGATGLVTGAHLHWEVRVANVAVDPEVFIGSSLIDKTLILSMIE